MSKNSPAPPIEIIARGLVVAGPWVLLCRAIKPSGASYLYLPGGHVEPTESARASLEREFLEECGLKVRAGELAWVSESRFTTRKRTHHEIVLTFHVEPPSKLRLRDITAAKPPPSVASLEPKIAFEWMRLREAGKHDVRPASHRDYLAELGRGRAKVRSRPVRFLSDME